MKLNEYIFKRIMNMSDPDTMSDYFTEDDVEKWIVEWYMSEFRKVGCDGELEGDTSRLPPMWLANWRKFVHERSVVEQERCGIDEG